jgi:hypothetical protein
LRAQRRRLATVLVLANIVVICTGASAAVAPRAVKHARTAEAVRIVSFDRMPVIRPRYEPPRVIPVQPLPDGSTRLLPGHRIVAFYGAAGTSGLGVLGSDTPDRVWPRLSRQAVPYRTRHTLVLPAYELIAFLATGSSGNRGNYSSRVPDSTIARYARAAKRHHGLLILDIQPGRGQFLTDARSLRRWLRLPYVGLALDPEWQLYGVQRPLSGIGHTNAYTVNRVSHWLNHLTRVNHLPQKLLLVHEFTDDMVRNKPVLRARTQLAMVFNVDGFGGRAAKVGKYRDFAQDRSFPLGFKLFYDMDIDMMSARDVLRLHPRPSVVEYE